jgi:hypothetical protein
MSGKKARGAKERILEALSKQLSYEINAASADEAVRERFAQEVLDRLKNKPSGEAMGTWDVYALEIESARALTLSELKIRVVAYRDLLANLMTPKSYAQLSTTFFQDVKSADESKKEALREELFALCGRLHRRYALVSEIEAVRAAIVKTVLWWAIATVAPAMIFLSCNALLRALEPSFDIDTMYLIAVAGGGMGAALSTIIRLYSVDTRSEPMLTWLTLEKSAMSIVITPVIGSLFAVLLIFVLRTGVIDADIFPDFDRCWWFGGDPGLINCGWIEYAKRSDMLAAYHRDIAKFAIWSFIAGWTERFVPDLINRIAVQGQAQTRSSHPAGKED